jgi:hypothetical protein
MLLTLLQSNFNFSGTNLGISDVLLSLRTLKSQSIHLSPQLLAVLSTLVKLTLPFIDFSTSSVDLFDTSVTLTLKLRDRALGVACPTTLCFEQLSSEGRFGSFAL